MIDRQKVYDKYSGHCAYCGKEIEYKDMQVDHIQPQRLGGSDDLDNLNPSCRLCNHYKRAETVETFRKWQLGGLIERLRKNYIFRVAIAFRMVEIKGWNGKFYWKISKKAHKSSVCG